MRCPAYAYIYFAAPDTILYSALQLKYVYILRWSFSEFERPQVTKVPDVLYWGLLLHFTPFSREKIPFPAH